MPSSTCKATSLLSARRRSPIARPPRWPMLTHVDLAAACGADEPHAGRQRPGRGPMVDLQDLPGRHASLAVKIDVFGADWGAHRRPHRRQARSAADLAIPQDALAAKSSAGEL